MSARFLRPRRLRAVFGATSGLAAAAAIAVACSDDPARESFPIEPGSDAQASLPDAPPPYDGGGEPDAKIPYDPKDEPIICSGSPCVREVVAGKNHFCARLDDGTVRCWGDATSGALGAAATPDAGTGTGDAGKSDAGDAGKTDAGDAGVPIHAVAGLSSVTQLSASGSTTCALVADGRVLCWGGNTDGQLGLSAYPAVTDGDPHPVPQAVALGGKAVRVDVGPVSACAVLEGGAVWCWGSDDQLQLGRADGGTTPEYGSHRGPAPAATGSLAVARTALSLHTTLSLTASGEVWSWGASGTKEGLAAGRVSSLANSREPKAVVGIAKATSLAVSSWFQPETPFPPGGGIELPGEPPEPIAHGCVLAGGQVLCWGRSDRGALCTGLPDREITPRDAPVISKAWPQQLAVAEELTCARLTDGTVQCCGEDRRGRLGTGAPLLYSPYFTAAAGFTGHAVQIATGDGAVCALVQGGSVACWGSNEHGELGRGPADTLDHRSATAVAF